MSGPFAFQHGHKRELQIGVINAWCGHLTMQNLRDLLHFALIFGAGQQCQRTR
jgi:hypothetical protein